MTKAKLVFDPFSLDFFNGAYETYRRMRDEAPVYYNEQHDFYALTRHEDVAPAFKDFETYSSAYGVDLASIRNGLPTDAGPRMIIFMDPPEHRNMRSLLNKVFTPRAIQAQTDNVNEKIEKYLSRLDPDGFDAVQEFTAPFPVEVITTMLGVPEEQAQQVRHWIDDSLHREVGRGRGRRTGDAGQHRPGDVLLRPGGQSGVPTHRTISSASSWRPSSSARTARWTSSTISKSRLSQAFSAEPARRRSPSWSVTRCICSPRTRTSGRSCRRTAARFPPPSRSCCVTRRPRSTTCAATMKEVHLHGTTIPEGMPVFLIGGSANRDERAWTDADKFDIDRDRTEAQNLGMGYGIHSCLGAALARLESTIALDKLLDFMPRFEVDFDNCKRVQMQNVVGWKHVPVKVLR